MGFYFDFTFWSPRRVPSPASPELCRCFFLFLFHKGGYKPISFMHALSTVHPLFYERTLQLCTPILMGEKEIFRSINCSFGSIYCTSGRQSHVPSIVRMSPWGGELGLWKKCEKFAQINISLDIFCEICQKPFTLLFNGRQRAKASSHSETILSNSALPK